MLERMWRKGNPPTLLMGMQTGAGTMENSMGIPQKIKNILYNNAVPLLDTYLEEKETLIGKYICTPCSLQHYFL